jgi:hypothetical protein
LFYYLWKHQGGKCYLCESDLRSDSIVLSHDIGHDRKESRYTTNATEINARNRDVNFRPEEQQDPFDTNLAEADEVDLYNMFYLFSLIHSKCNTNLSNTECRNCGKKCDSIFCWRNEKQKMNDIRIDRITAFDTMYPDEILDGIF